MNIYYFKVEYNKYNIKIFNKKIKFYRYIKKCNQFCNSINPIYCNNCLLKIISDSNLNYNFSDYILYNDNDFYHVLRNSINFNQNIYNNYYDNYYENINYMQNENYFNQMYNNSLQININDYYSENYEIKESNYDFENSTIQSNSLSDVTLDKSLINNKNIKDKTIKDNDEHVS